MAARRREGAANWGAEVTGRLRTVAAARILTGCRRKNTRCHERGHGVMKQRAWRESAEQHGAAWQSGPANEGPRTHEDGGARGAPHATHGAHRRVGPHDGRVK